MSFSWRCPYCGQAATITHLDFSSDVHTFRKRGMDGHLGIFTDVIICPSPGCGEYAISARLCKCTPMPDGQCRQDGSPLMRWQLRPQSKAKQFPAYVPEPIRHDYEEACLIKDLSPKASATLSRRCLQGTIRDFWGITRDRLIDEINELKGRVDQATWEAIDAVRSIGNIGAHMEKDIDLIVHRKKRRS